MTDLTKSERIRLIKKALKDCDQLPLGADALHEAVKRQYEYETGEPYNEEPE